MDAYREERPGIRIAYRMNGHLLSQRRMHFQSRVSTTTAHKLLFVDDCTLNVTPEGELQRTMDFFDTACDNFGLVINRENTVVMHQLSPDGPYIAPEINVNGVQMQVVGNSTYLGNTLSRTTKINDKVARQLFEASQAFGRLQNTI
nr:unnamed protein product [Spirometra erinaceieuropaei]